MPGGSEILAQLYYRSSGLSISIELCIGAQMVSGEWYCISEASNKQLAIPYAMNGTSIALYILFSLTF
jgi:hypothetical protein